MFRIVILISKKLTSRFAVKFLHHKLWKDNYGTKDKNRNRKDRDSEDNKASVAEIKSIKWKNASKINVIHKIKQYNLAVKAKAVYQAFFVISSFCFLESGISKVQSIQLPAKHREKVAQNGFHS